MQFLSLFTSTSTVVSKCEIRDQRVYKEYTLRSNAILDWLIVNERAKTNLAMLAFLYFGEIEKKVLLALTVADAGFPRWGGGAATPGGGGANMLFDQFFPKTA